MEQDADKVYQEVLDLDLHRIPEFDTLTPAEFAEIYNGCGPDSWPEHLRDIMTWFYRNFKPVIAVHDVEYAFSDGTRRNWDLTQSHWEMNLEYVISKRYPMKKPWLWPVRLYAWIKIRVAYRVLTIGSFIVWKAAAEKLRERIK